MISEKDKENILENIHDIESELGYVPMSLYNDCEYIDDFKKIFSEYHNWDVRFFKDLETKTLYCVPLSTQYRFVSMVEKKLSLLKKRSMELKNILFEVKSIQNNELF